LASKNAEYVLVVFSCLVILWEFDLCQNVVEAVNRLMRFIYLPNYTASQSKITTCTGVLFGKSTVPQLRYRKKHYVTTKGFYYVCAGDWFTICVSPMGLSSGNTFIQITKKSYWDMTL
jgi:hypothetical protein